jgi:hypothetical protein
MRISDFSRYAFGICAVAALLAGCGGSRPPIGATAAMPQRSAIATHVERGKSWILPEAKNEDLIYATGGCGRTCVISYPDGTLVGSLPVGGPGACVDRSGDVFIADNNEVAEYAHGGSTQIATLNLPGDNAGGCSVDPTTGNLAVLFAGDNVGVAIFADASGSPTTYTAGIDGIGCGYDDKGNLFVSGLNGQDPGLSELPAGATQFSILNISGEVGYPNQVQWDGHYMSYEGGADKGHITASRLRISGSTATVIHVTHFRGITGYAYLSWIYNGKILMPFSPRHTPEASIIGVWRYPGGGNAVSVYQPSGKPPGVNFQAVTLSTAQ